MESSGAPAKKRRKFAVPKLMGFKDSDWVSKFNLEGKVVKTTDEVGDGDSSRVYKGYIDGRMVPVKQIKLYSPRHVATLIAVHESLFELSHTNIVQVLGICPKQGQIILEYCEKNIDGTVVRTLADMQLQSGGSLPEDLRVTAIADFADGVQYLHEKGVIHGDIKPLNNWCVGIVVMNLSLKSQIMHVLEIKRITMHH